MKNLKGTEKQIKWATTLRDDFVKIIENFKFDFGNTDEEYKDFTNNLKFMINKNSIKFLKLWKKQKKEILNETQNITDEELEKEKKKFIYKLAYDEFIKTANFIIDNEEDSVFYIDNRYHINNNKYSYFNDIHTTDFAYIVNYYYDKNKLYKDK